MTYNSRPTIDLDEGRNEGRGWRGEEGEKEVREGVGG